MSSPLLGASPYENSSLTLSIFVSAAYAVNAVLTVIAAAISRHNAFRLFITIPSLRKYKLFPDTYIYYNKFIASIQFNNTYNLINILSVKR